MHTSKEISITTVNDWVDIPFDLERPFLKVVECHAKYTDEKLDHKQFKLTLEIFYANGETLTNSRLVSVSQKERSMPFSSFNLDLENAKKCKVKFEYQNEDQEFSEVILRYEPMEYLEMNLPAKKFVAHLTNPKNTKILFSSAFGQGKSTFLDLYFKTQANNYSAFKVFPVNYSVASNEDIFKYIKSDILSQLLLRGIEFDVSEMSYSKAFMQHLKSNPVKVFAPFLQSIPKVGKQIYEIFEEVRKKVFADDKKSAEEFVKDVYEAEGGIYEDNFFTQLIRYLLEKNKNKQGGENVLIIDDLDRMDPEHIFRILNVISAHYDTFRLFDDVSQNKFGFDKIIVVCDIKNIEYIFQHRYGPKTHFEGYINKFYSSEIFHFDNKAVYLDLVCSFKGNNLKSHYQKLYAAFEFVSKCFIDSGQLSLREILKLQIFPLWMIKQETNELLNQVKSPYLAGSLFAPVILLFSKLVNLDSLINRFEKCKEVDFDFDEDIWNSYARLAIIGIAQRREKDQLALTFKSGEVRMTVDYDSYYVVKEIRFFDYNLKSEETFSTPFTKQEFFDFMIQNTKRIRDLM